MKSIFQNEFARNLTGFVLLFVGVLILGVGEKGHLANLARAGEGMVSASLLAFQAKRSPESKPGPTDPA